MTDAPVRLEPGVLAPDFTLDDAEGHQVALAAHLGHRVIVYFYPAALTPGCTTEACDFRDNLSELAEMGVAVLAVSPDQPERLRKFRDQEGLTFPLLSDPDLRVLRAYGAYGQKQSYGRRAEGVIRSTFVIDPAGRVEKAYYNVKATGHVDRLRADLAATQASS